MSMFEESGDFDGALREKSAAPRVPPRRRRGQGQAEENSEVQEDSAAPAPAVKKNAGWSDESAAAPAAGRRAAPAEGDVPTASIETKESAPEKTEDLLQIPDLEEADEDSMPSVAEPGFVEAAALPTNLTLDEGALPPVQVEGIDLGLLYECLIPQKHLLADEGSWDPDTMFNELKQAMQEESDARDLLDTGEKR